MNEKRECAQSMEPVNLIPFSFLFILHIHRASNVRANNRHCYLFTWSYFYYILDICYFEMVLHMTGTKKNEEIKQ